MLIINWKQKRFLLQIILYFFTKQIFIIKFVEIKPTKIFMLIIRIKDDYNALKKLEEKRFFI